MKIKKHYYLMISCPGDVSEEKEYLKQSSIKTLKRNIDESIKYNI